MSGITIPLAQLAGRAAAPQAPEPAGGGEAVARFGEAIGRIGDALETDRLDRAMVRARIDMQRGLGQAALDLKSEGDPDALDAGWEQRSTALRQQVVDGADPRIRARVGLAFDELSDRHALSIGARALDLRQSAVLAGLDEQAEAYVASAPGADPGVRAANLAHLQDSVGEAMARGVITPQEASQRLRGATAGGATAVAIGDSARDPAGFLTRLDAGEYADLDPLERERMRAGAQKEVERQVAVRGQAIDKELDAIVELSAKGVTAAQAGLLDDPEVQARPKYAQARAAVDLTTEQPALGIMTVGELDTLIAEEKKKPIVRQWQAERLQVLEAKREAAATGWSTDPVAYAGSVGVQVPALDFGALDSGDPGALARQLQVRQAWGQALAGQGYGDAVAAMPLSQEEQAELKRRTAVGEDPLARASLAAALVAGLGPRRASQVSGDPVFAHMGGFIAAGGAVATAREVFRGEQAIASGTVKLPPEKDRLGAGASAVGDVFAAMPGGAAIQAQVSAAADALYAARMAGTDPGGPINSAKWQQALQDVMGGTGSGSNARGGIREVRGAATILPAGVRARDVERSLFLLTNQGLAQVADAPGAGDMVGAWQPEGGQVLPDTAYMTPILATISTDGRVPDVGGQPMRARDMDYITLRATGPDAFVFVYRNGGDRPEQVLAAADGRPWTFSMTKLLRQVPPEAGGTKGVPEAAQ